MAATRRELLREGMAASAAVGGVGIALALLPPASEAAAVQSQAQVLTHALKIEQLVVVAYRQVLGSSLLTQNVRGQLQTHLAQELEHVASLERATAGLSVTVPPSPSVSAAQAELRRHQIHWKLNDLRSQHDCLKLLVDVESLAENAYFRAVEKVQDLAVVGMCAQIMGCEAQHWTVLSGFLNHENAVRAVPYPFVEGTP